MRKLWKYKTKILYHEYEPKSQLHVPETKIEHAGTPVIDAHMHWGGHTKEERFETRYDTGKIVEELKGIGIKHCVELTLYNKEMWERVHRKVNGYEDFFSFCAPINLEGYQKPMFEQHLKEEMDYYAAEGAVGYKVWKDLGLSLKDRNGVRVKLNDPSFDFIWEKAAELKLPVVLHVADPPAFFEPADRFNERLEEIVQYHFWHHYQKGLKFLDFIEQLDSLLGAWPDTRFLVAHLCSYPSNLDHVTELMKRHDNLYTDIAATLSEIGRQPRRFYRFATEFQDRILFGTDYFAGDSIPHLPYFRFFETEDEYFPYSVNGKYEHGRWNIYGCNLEYETREKIYYKNAECFFGLNVGKEEKR